MRRSLFARESLDEQTRRRAAALAGVTVFLAVLLILLGLGIVVLVVLIVAASAAAMLALRRAGAGAAVARRARAVWGNVRDGRKDKQDDATLEMALAGPSTRTELAAKVTSLSSATRQRIQAVRTRSVDREVSPSVLGLEAARCNTFGVALRRAGHVKQAATLHEAARLIALRTGDSRSEALTANVLGVALAEDGRQDAALQQFARARTLLRELGDREWEGKVLANIGLAKQRVGQDDQAVEFLQSALDLLEPETEAYGRVERRLKRAG